MKKYQFQSVLIRARRKKNPYGDTEMFMVKNVDANTSVNQLKDRGWKQEGYHEGLYSHSWGMTNGTEHITVSDSGKPPYYLGDTTIHIRPLTSTRLYTAPRL